MEDFSNNCPKEWASFTTSYSKNWKFLFLSQHLNKLDGYPFSGYLFQTPYSMLLIFFLIARMLVISYCCGTNYPQTWWVKNTSVYYLTFSEAQESGSSFAGHFCIRVSRIRGYLSARVVSEGLPGNRGPTSELAPVIVGRNLWFLGHSAWCGFPQGGIQAHRRVRATAETLVSFTG